ncbi:MAG TPA: tetratricopeptide repeat protein [Bryobacteraceae bacterium]|jgi:tetratricopeptide (TPR) repeat protein|nr:tetratricopeptide repeat protein [Bryobacteraceae bacterium]
MILVSALMAAIALAQAPPAKPSAAVQQLAESGHCREAMPLLKTAVMHATDPETKKRLGLDGVHCGMTLHDLDSAAGFLHTLTSTFPNDPEVLYLTVHVYSELSVRASQKLMATAPTSYHVRLLNGEALEAQGKWDEAIAEYREVLKRTPALPGIHYRVGRLVLSGPKTDENKKAAQSEFEEELKIDPSNAGAEYILGELARQDQQFPVAIGHFEHATKLDAGFADAFIGLGRAMLEDGHNAEAVAPLQTAAKLRPDNPAAHFYLSTAYRRTGHPEEAQRELALHEQASEKVRQMKQEIETGVGGSPQKAVH